MLSTVHVIADGVDRRRHLPLFYSYYAHFLKDIIAFFPSFPCLLMLL